MAVASGNVARFLVMAIAVGLAVVPGCRGQAQVVDHCLSAPGTCPPCSAKADCLFAGNPCTETVYCASRGAGPAVIDIGCDSAAEYDWPDEEHCACVSSVCRYVE